LESSTAGKDCEYFETLLDVKSACSIAVEILNDLLSFDKMESGILELHKQEVNVAPLIIDSVNMFASQAKEADVTISVIPPTTATLGMGTTARRDLGMSLSQPLTCTSNHILHGDAVLIDRFKMDQVLRNLLSNALKFTPRGGFVTVCASFIPDSSEEDLPATDQEMKCIDFTSNWLQRVFKREPRIHLVIADPQKPPITDIEYGINDNVNDSNRYLDLVPNPTTISTIKHSRRKLLENDSSNNVYECSGKSTTHGCDSTATTRESSGLNNAMTNDEYVTGKLRIVVKDSGVGISAVNIQRLFKEVVQFNPEILQAGGGSGLGLHITNNIVQMHGGTIAASSEGFGKGSTFTVEINMQRKKTRQNDEPWVTAIRPLKVGPSKTSSPVTVPQGSSSLSLCCDSRDGSGAKPLDLSQVIECLNAVTSDGQDPRQLFRNQNFPDPRTPPMLESYTFNKFAENNAGDNTCYDVLVVDDSSLNRKLLCKLFRTAGYTCEEADDGIRAIEKVKTRMARNGGQSQYFDAILMDFVMPNMDGPTATQAIRALNYPGIIFGVTGNALDADVTHFLSSGVDSVLPKPFDFSLFKQLMKQKRESPV
jgi:signal transduction histidine kinase/CheY-like chemotaxis protein